MMPASSRYGHGRAERGDCGVSKTNVHLTFDFPECPSCLPFSTFILIHTYNDAISYGEHIINMEASIKDHNIKSKHRCGPGSVAVS